MNDWYRFKREIGLTDKMEASAPNHVEMHVTGKFSMAPSDIHGTGVFAADSFLSGETIGPAWINGKRTQLGSFVNHSITPNARMNFIDTGVWLVALDDVSTGDELTTNYRDTFSTMRARGVTSYV